MKYTPTPSATNANATYTYNPNPCIRFECQFESNSAKVNGRNHHQSLQSMFCIHTQPTCQKCHILDCGCKTLKYSKTTPFYTQNEKKEKKAKTITYIRIYVHTYIFTPIMCTIQYQIKSSFVPLVQHTSQPFFLHGNVGNTIESIPQLSQPCIPPRVDCFQP